MDRCRIISEIKWGLGNQLFQFSNGYALAHRLHLPLDIDVSWFTNAPKYETPRNLAITKIAPRKLYRHTISRKAHTMLSDKALRALTVRKRGPYRFGIPLWPSTSSAKTFHDIERPVCLRGVNANYQNLASVWAQISAEIHDSLSNHMPPDISAATKPTHAFVHVRRGDLITDPKAHAKMRLLDARFYKEAMQAVERVSGRQRWIVCSDDPKAAETLISDSFIAEESPAKNEIEDLAIMANASSGVIANSTLSLFAALICDTGATPIAAPNSWTNTGEWGPPGRDRPKVPKRWILI